MSIDNHEFRMTLCRGEFRVWEQSYYPARRQPNRPIEQPFWMWQLVETFPIFGYKYTRTLFAWFAEEAAWKSIRKRMEKAAAGPGLPEERVLWDGTTTFAPWEDYR